MRTLTKYAAAAGLAGALGLGAAGSSVAAPQSSPAGIKANSEATTDMSAQRRHRAHRRVYRHHYGPGPFVAGAALGIIGAGVAAATAPRYYYSEPYPYYGGPAYGYGPSYGYHPYW